MSSSPGPRSDGVWTAPGGPALRVSVRLQRSRRTGSEAVRERRESHVGRLKDAAGLLQREQSTVRKCNASSASPRVLAVLRRAVVTGSRSNSHPRANRNATRLNCLAACEHLVSRSSQALPERCVIVRRRTAPPPSLCRPRCRLLPSRARARRARAYVGPVTSAACLGA